MSGGKHVLVGESPTLVTHGATAGTARPTGSALVQWRGTVAPTNATTNDEWYDQANDLLKRWNGTAWKVAGGGTYPALSSAVKLPGVRTPSDYATTQHVFDSEPEPMYPPRLVIPPASTFSAAGSGAWYTANNFTAMRFSVERTRTYRYVNLSVGTQSGNIMVGVARILPSNATTVLMTSVKDSGVIACPAAGPQQIDLGYFTLPPGDYALFLWCDNTTAAFLHSLASGINASRMTFSGSFAATFGAPQSASVTTRWVSGLTLEAPNLPVTLLGDSITANDAAGVGATGAWFSNMDRDTGYRFRPSYTNAGVAGNTTAQMVARLTDLTGSGARYATILGGTNDVGGDIDAATTIANLQTMYAAAQGMASLVGFAACTIMPRANTAGDPTPLTTARANTLKTINAWIRSNYTTYSKATLVDWTWALSDGTDETSPLAANFADYVHPTTPGTAIMAALLTKAVRGWI